MGLVQFKGYHGTKTESARLICRDKYFKPSINSSEWLGKGIYFFKDDSTQAFLFAKYRHKKEDITVLCIDIESENFIDMSITEDRNEVEFYLGHILKAYRDKNSSAYKNLIRKHPELKGGLKEEASDGIILDLMYEVEPFDLVICPFEIPKKRKSKFLRSKAIHMQICVKNNDCINYDTLKEVDKNEFE